VNCGHLNPSAVITALHSLCHAICKPILLPFHKIGKRAKFGVDGRSRSTERETGEAGGSHAGA
tara:strand:- start:98 stop:286 length:189 start_codon:yes stop_codon:yes gene_type:complete